jgi:LETM1 and EF-hand domain-containing protein 1
MHTNSRAFSRLPYPAATLAGVRLFGSSAAHAASSTSAAARLQRSRLSTPFSTVRRFSSAPKQPNQQSNNDAGAASASSSNAPAPSSSSAPPPFVPVTPVLSDVETWGTKTVRAWNHVKHELRHYWLGTKLLWKEVKLASRLLLAIARGHEMSRRERRQLLRTSADLVRMVPFIVILVIPFAEFALPVLLKVSRLTDRVASCLHCERFI